jgi:hypothetical protein
VVGLPTPTITASYHIAPGPADTKLPKLEGTISAGSVAISISVIVRRNLWKSIRQVNVPNARHDGKRKGDCSNGSVPQQEIESGKKIGEGKEAHRKEEPGNGPGLFDGTMSRIPPSPSKNLAPYSLHQRAGFTVRREGQDLIHMLQGGTL